MECRHCNNGDVECQEHLEKCSGTIDERRGLRNLEKGNNKLIFWQCLNRKPKDKIINKKMHGRRKNNRNQLKDTPRKVEKQ